MTKAKKPAVTAASAAIKDVSHPDTSAPSDTSKPIINQRPMIKDPMVVDDDEKPAVETELPAPKRTSEPKIAPLEEPAKDEVVAPETEAAKPDETAPEEPKKPEKPDVAVKAKAEQDAKLRKLIESKKYSLPINAVEHRKSAHFAVAGIILALILAVAWADVALDAGLIHLGGIKPVTHLFSN